MRRRLLVHAFNRRVAGGLLVAIGVIVIHRALNLMRPGPIDQVLQLDLLMMTGAAAIAAVTLARAKAIEARHKIPTAVRYASAIRVEVIR